MSLSLSVAAGLGVPLKFQKAKEKSKIAELIKQRYPIITVNTINDLAKELNTSYKSVSDYINQCRVSGIGTKGTITGLVKIFKPHLLRSVV